MSLADLSFVEFEEHEGRTPGLLDAVFTWPEQPVADGLRSGSVLVAGGPGQSGFATLVSVDRDQRTVTLRWTAEREQAGFFPRALVASEWVDPEPKPTVLGGLARQVLGLPGAGSPRPVTLSLLERALPRFLPGAGPADGLFRHDDLDSILSWVGDLDSSFVAIQGPPGTGKTYRGAHIVHALVTSGKRVGISAFGHTAIDNLLEAVHAVFEERESSLGSRPARSTRTSPRRARSIGSSTRHRTRRRRISSTTWWRAPRGSSPRQRCKLPRSTS